MDRVLHQSAGMPKDSTNATAMPIVGIYIGASDGDFWDLNHIFSRRGWVLSLARNREQALAQCSFHKASHVIYEHCPRDRGWIDVLDVVSSGEQAQSFILASRTADEELWADVLNRGGYDVLLMPFDEVEVWRIISSAWRYMKRRIRGRSMVAPEGAIVRIGTG